jgi:hypothetical protein
MNKNEIGIQTLIYYLDGLLSPERQKQVTEKLKADELLAAQMEGIIALRKAYPDRDVEDLIEELDAFDVTENVTKGQQPETKVIELNRGRTLNIWRIAVAASVALVIGFSIFLATRSGNDREFAMVENKIFMDHDFSTRGSSESDWISALESKNYAEVIHQLAGNAEINNEEKYALAMAYTNIKEYVKAIALFSDLIEFDEMKDEAYLGLAICEYHRGNKKAASDAASQSNHRYAGELLELLKD